MNASFVEYVHRWPPVLISRMTTMESLIAHQELFLRILSFLDTPNELVRVQGVNSYWSRMSLDPQVSYLDSWSKTIGRYKQ